jgi:hypothetical protein
VRLSGWSVAGSNNPSGHCIDLNIDQPLSGIQTSAGNAYKRINAMQLKRLSSIATDANLLAISKFRR